MHGALACYGPFDGMYSPSARAAVKMVLGLVGVDWWKEVCVVVGVFLLCFDILEMIIRFTCSWSKVLAS